MLLAPVALHAAICTGTVVMLIITLVGDFSNGNVHSHNGKRLGEHIIIAYLPNT